MDNKLVALLLPVSLLLTACQYEQNGDEVNASEMHAEYTVDLYKQGDNTQVAKLSASFYNNQKLTFNALTLDLSDGASYVSVEQTGMQHRQSDFTLELKSPTQAAGQYEVVMRTDAIDAIATQIPYKAGAELTNPKQTSHYFDNETLVTTWLAAPDVVSLELDGCGVSTSIAVNGQNARKDIDLALFDLWSFDDTNQCELSITLKSQTEINLNNQFAGTHITLNSYSAPITVTVTLTN